MSWPPTPQERPPPRMFAVAFSALTAIAVAGRLLETYGGLEKAAVAGLLQLQATRRSGRAVARRASRRCRRNGFDGGRQVGPLGVAICHADQPRARRRRAPG